MERNKKFLLFCEAVIDEQIILHTNFFDGIKVSEILILCYNYLVPAGLVCLVTQAISGVSGAMAGQ
jgi:hypothetical protein